MHQAVLEARDIRKAYRGHPVLRGANLAVGPGAPPAAPSHSRDGPAAAAPALEAAPDRDTWHAAGLAPGLWTETPPPVLFSECRTGPRSRAGPASAACRLALPAQKSSPGLVMISSSVVRSAPPVRRHSRTVSSRPG